jgi:hypothetical protein
MAELGDLLEPVREMRVLRGRFWLRSSRDRRGKGRRIALMSCDWAQASRPSGRAAYRISQPERTFSIQSTQSGRLTIPKVLSVFSICSMDEICLCEETASAVHKQRRRFWIGRLGRCLSTMRPSADFGRNWSSAFRARCESQVSRSSSLVRRICSRAVFPERNAGANNWECLDR